MLPPMLAAFTPLDGAIVLLYLGATLAIGIYVHRYLRGMSEFLVAGRTLRTWLGAATLIGSELGLVTAMYAAQKGFSGGFSSFHIGLIAGIVTLGVGWTGFLVVPLRERGILTIPEFYEQRFGTRRIRILGGSLLAGAGILNMGLYLHAGAVFVSGITGGVDAVTLKLVMTGLIALVLVYTCLGGMLSVILTDYVQFVILSLGLLLACGIAFSQLGWQRLVDTVRAVHGDAGTNPFDGEIFGPSYVLWMAFLGIVSCAVWQTAVLRACAAESAAVVRKLYVRSSLGFLVRFLIPQFLGICALAYFFRHPEHHARFFDAEGAVLASESLIAMPVFLGEILPIGVLGLVAAGMLAAFMSTHDTYLLCWSAVLTEDVVQPSLGRRLSESSRIRLTRILLVLIAAFLLLWSMWFPLGQDLWDYMAVTGAIYFIGAFVVLTAGIYWPRASRLGAELALLCGLGAVAGLTPVQKALGVAWRAEHVGLVTMAIAIGALVAGSLLFPDRPRGEGGR